MSCVGPVYLVIFCYWVGPVPYLELYGVGPVEKNTLYITSSPAPPFPFLRATLFLLAISSAIAQTGDVKKE